MNSYIGTLKGDFAVNSDGAAIYKLPIDIPSGTAHMAPEISLIYNSSAGNDLLGIGWILSGLSSIKRVGKTISIDGAAGTVNFDSNDRLSLDGQRLISTSANYFDADSVYATELESFRKIVPVYKNTPNRQGPDAFIVYERDGRILEYGTDTSAQIAPSPDNPSLRTWALNKVTDKNGNFVLFSYLSDEGSFYPSCISYTGNSKDLQPNRIIQFNYEVRTDPFTIFEGGYAITMDKHLKSIDILVSGTKAYSYILQYEQGKSSGKSRIVSIARSDSDGNLLNPTLFDWQDNNPELLYSSTNLITTSQQAGGEVLPVDVNGNGHMDFVNISQNNSNIVLDLFSSKTDGSGFLSPVTSPVPTTGAVVSGGSFLPMDINADGCTELVYYNTTPGAPLNITIFAPEKNLQGDYCYLQGPLNGGLSEGSQLKSGGDMYTADINGDGAVDLVYITSNNYKATFNVLLSNGSGFTPSEPLSTSLGSGGMCIPLDFNGDGRTDIIYAYNNYNSLQLALLLSDGSQLGLSKSELLSPNKLPFGGALLSMDINGDGLMDIIYATSTKYKDKNVLSLTPLINTGTGLNIGEKLTFNDILFDSVLMPGDFNGDGKTDITAAVRNGNSTVLYMLQSTGTGFRQLSLSSQPLEDINFSTIFPADVSGKGMVGLINLGQDNNKLTITLVQNTGNFPDVITCITNGLGGKHSIGYLPITDDSIYSHTSKNLNPQGMINGQVSGASFPISSAKPGLQAGNQGSVSATLNFAFPKYVVSSHTKSDGRNNNYRYSYQYSDASLDLKDGRGWQGFEEQVCNDYDIGTTTTTLYHTGFPLTGLVDTSTVETINNQVLINKSCFIYDQAKLPNGTSHVTIKSRENDLYTFGTFNAKQIKSYEYDEFGNQTLETDLGDGSGEPIYTIGSYLNDTENWILGLAISKIRSRDANGCDVLSSEKLSYAPNTTNLVSHKLWHDQTGLWLETTTEYDAYGNPIKQTDPSGGIKEVTYDDVYQTFPVSKTKTHIPGSPGLITRYEYDVASGQVTAITDPNGVRFQQKVDPVGRIYSVQGPTPDNAAVELNNFSWSKDDFGYFTQELRATSWNGKNPISRLEYKDGFGRTFRTATLAADGTTKIYSDKEFNSKNNVIRKSLPYLFGTTPAYIDYSYDAYGRVVKTTRPSDDNSTSVTTYDYPDIHTTVETLGFGSSLSRKTTTQNGIFNGQHLPVKITDALGAETNICYDALGRMIKTVDPAGFETLIKYDSLNNKIDVVNQSNGNIIQSEANEYDLVKRSIKSTAASGSFVNIQLDAMGRLSSKWDDMGNTTSFVYDSSVPNGLSRLCAVHMPNDTSYTFEYDAYGNQTGISLTLKGTEYKLSKEFLPFHMPASTIFPDGSKQSFSYTSGGMVDSICLSTGASGSASVNFADYNSFGKPSSILYGNGAKENLSFNEIGQLSSQTVIGSGDISLQSSQFHWNLLDELDSINDLIKTDRIHSFQYDSVGRLSSASIPDIAPQVFNYDSAGNIIEKNGSKFDYSGGLLKTAGNISLENDTNGNTSKIVEQSGSSMELKYDSQGQLSEAGGCSFEYDYLGRRIVKQTPGGITTYYIAPGYEITLLPDETILSTKYLRSHIGIVASITSSNRAGADTSKYPGIPSPGIYYFHRNQINSSTLVTDNEGKVIASADYLPFGELNTFSGNDVFRYKFAGRERDSETGLYYFGARYYMPSAGRFISPDNQFGASIGRPDALNFYAYVLNSPIFNVDPTGHSFWGDIGGFFTDVGNSIAHVSSAFAKIIASGTVKAVTYLKKTAQVWVPYLVDGLLIVGGASAIYLGNPFLGGILLGAGINGLMYNVSHNGDFSWRHWGVQLGIGATTAIISGGMGAIFEGSTILGSELAAQIALGGADGAIGSSLGQFLTNLDNGNSASSGIGMAALSGALEGASFKGAMTGGKQAIEKRIGRAIDEMNFEEIGEKTVKRNLSKIISEDSTPYFGSSGLLRPYDLGYDPLLIY